MSSPRLLHMKKIPPVSLRKRAGQITAQKSTVVSSVPSSFARERYSSTGGSSGLVQRAFPAFPVSQWRLRDTLPSQLRDSTGLSPVFLHSEAFCFVAKKADYPPKIIFALLYATEFHFTIRIPLWVYLDFPLLSLVSLFQIITSKIEFFLLHVNRD